MEFDLVKRNITDKVSMIKGGFPQHHFLTFGVPHSFEALLKPVGGQPCGSQVQGTARSQGIEKLFERLLITVGKAVRRVNPHANTVRRLTCWPVWDNDLLVNSVNDRLVAQRVHPLVVAHYLLQ